MKNQRLIQKNKVKNAQGGNKKPKGSEQPPQLISNITWSHTFRFLSTAAFNGTLTDYSLIGIVGAMGIVAGAPATGRVSCIASAFKINYVEMWGMTGANGTTLSIDWIGGLNSPNKEFSDTTLSNAFPSHIRCKPPPLSLGSFWTRPITGGPNVNMFNLICPNATVIDINVTVILHDTGTVPIAFATAVTTIVLGVMYYGYLDQTSGTTAGVLAPVSLNSFT